MSKEPEPRARRRDARRVIDWHQAAELLAEGLTIAAVAERVGCARATIVRKRRQDLAFQAMLSRCCDAQPQPDRGPPPQLRSKLHGAVEEQVRAGDVRMILWLAERFKLVTPPSQSTPTQELRAILNELTPEELEEFDALRDEP